MLCFVIESWKAKVKVVMMMAACLFPKVARQS